MALVGVELETLFSEPDALTTRPPLKIKLNKGSINNYNDFERCLCSFAKIDFFVKQLQKFF